jgi:hypothetical protein
LRGAERRSNPGQRDEHGVTLPWIASLRSQ